MNYDYAVLLAVGALLASAAIVFRGEQKGADAAAGAVLRRCRIATLAYLLLLTVVLGALWWSSGGNFFIRDSGESHVMYMIAANTRDWTTLLLSDQSASDPGISHPYLYSHHTLILGRFLPLLLGALGFPFEFMVFAAMMISVCVLAFWFSIFARQGRPLLGLCLVLVLSATYYSYFYAVGDLLRAYDLLFIAWFLFLVAENPLSRRPLWNGLLAASVFAITWHEWALGGFLMLFAAFWLTLSQGRIPWAAILKYFALPAFVALAIHRAVVAAVIGSEFAIQDLVISFFKRGAVIPGASEETWLSVFKAANVVIWHAPGHVTFDVIVGAMAQFFQSNGGPLAGSAVLLLLAAAVAGFLLRLRLGLVSSAVCLALGLAIYAGLLPMQILFFVTIYLVARYARSVPRDGRVGEDARYWLDSSRIKRDLGWEPTIDLREGVRDMIAWGRKYIDRLPEEVPEFVLRA